MSYLGRIVGVGLTKDGKPVCVYAVSGRSGSSKARKTHKYPTRVFIGSSLTKKPYDKITAEEKSGIVKYLDGSSPYSDVSYLIKDLTEEEKKIMRDQINNEQFIFYNAIKTVYNLGVVSNGLHTNGIARGNSIEGVLEWWGPELDGPNKTPYTPRIACAAEGRYLELGIVSRPEKINKTSIFEMFNSENGIIHGLSTYAGNQNAPREIVINHEPKLLELPAEGLNAKQLADDLFNWVDRDFVVCTAAAVYDRTEDKWNLATRDLNKV